MKRLRRPKHGGNAAGKKLEFAIGILGMMTTLARSPRRTIKRESGLRPWALHFPNRSKRSGFRDDPGRVRGSGIAAELDRTAQADIDGEVKSPLAVASPTASSRDPTSLATKSE